MKVKGNVGKLFMLRMGKAIDQTRLFSEVGHNPKITKVILAQNRAKLLFKRFRKLMESKIANLKFKFELKERDFRLNYAKIRHKNN